MNRTLWTLALLATSLLVNVPSAAAQPSGADVDVETDTVRELSPGSAIEERIEFHVTNTNTYGADASWTFVVQYLANNLSAYIKRGTGAEEKLTASEVSSSNPGSGVAFYNDVKINLTGKFSNLQVGEAFTLRLTYDLSGAYDHQLSVRPGQLIVNAAPLAGREPNATNLPAFTKGASSYQSVMMNPPAGFRYSVAFKPASATPSAPQAQPDTTKYVWLAGGLILGFLLALLFTRRSRKATKFEKAGQMESTNMLEARRRTLMAALKELEVAHEAKEIPDAAYAPLKEEYKAQAVRAMRALETKEPPAGGS